MKKDEPKNSKNLRALLKFTLSTKGFTITKLARTHMMNISNLCNAFYVPYPKGEAIIAAALDLQPWDLWPDRYGEDHKPNRKNRWYDRGRRKDNIRGSKSKEKNREVKGKILGEGNGDQPK